MTGGHGESPNAPPATTPPSKSTPFTPSSNHSLSRRRRCSRITPCCRLRSSSASVTGWLDCMAAVAARRSGVGRLVGACGQQCGPRRRGEANAGAGATVGGLGLGGAREMR
jgi:hypothetical protein